MRFYPLLFLDFSFASVDPTLIQEDMTLPVGFGADGVPRFYSSVHFVSVPDRTNYVDLAFESRKRRHPQHNPMSGGDYYFRVADTTGEYKVNFIGSQMRLMHANLGFDNKVSVGFGSPFLETVRRFLWLPSPALIVMPQNPSEYCYDGAMAMVGGQTGPKIVLPAKLPGFSNQRFLFNVDFSSQKILLPNDIFAPFVQRILDTLGSQRTVQDVANLDSWYIPSAMCAEHILRSFPALTLSVEDHLVNPTTATSQTIIYPEDYIRLDGSDCEILIDLADLSSGPTLGLPFIKHVALYLNQESAQLGFCEPL